MNLDRYSAWTTALAFALLLCSGVADANEARRPNIVLFLADDLGWRDAAVYGSEYYETPNIDRLASRGLRFTNAYSSSPLCSPTRAAILTGKSPGRLRLTTPAGHLAKLILDPKLPRAGPPHQPAVAPQTRTRLPNSEVTFAELLQGVGYRTAFFGKWHLGRDPYLPDNQGFELVVGGRHHPGPPGGYFSPWPIETIKPQADGEHITDRLAADAADYVRDATTRHADQPFLLCFWDYSVHAPFQAKEELKSKYAAKSDPLGQQDCPTMGAMIETLDDAVGVLTEALESQGVDDETLFIFASDNGGNMYNVVDETTPTNNAPLRNGKGSIYDGGHRVPQIVAWHGVVEPGSVTDVVTQSTDLFATMLDAGNVGLQERPSDTDAVSLMPVLKGEKGFSRGPIFTHFAHYVPATGNLPATSVRDGDWKLIRYYCDGPDQQDRLELYDLARDPGEQENLAVERSEIARRLNEMITEYLARTDALYPRPNRRFRADSGLNRFGK